MLFSAYRMSVETRGGLSLAHLFLPILRNRCRTVAREMTNAELTAPCAWFMHCPSPYGGPGWICHISGPTVCLLGRRSFTSNGRDGWIPHPIDAWPNGLHRGPGGLGAGLRRHDSAAAFDARPGRVPSIHARACDWRVLLDQ